MKQKFTILFDLDGTLVDTAPDLMLAHNHVMKKFGYPTKSTEDIRNLVGKGAGALIGRSIWGQAQKELSRKITKKDEEEIVYLQIATSIKYAKKGKRFERYERFSNAENLFKRFSGKVNDEHLREKLAKLERRVKKGLVKYQIKEE